MPSPRAKRLHKMKLGEVSVCDAGANQHARGMIVKRAINKEATMPEIQTDDPNANIDPNVPGGDDEYEYVLVDEEGNEVELVDPDDVEDMELADDGDDDDLDDLDDDEIVTKALDAADGRIEELEELCIEQADAIEKMMAQIERLQNGEDEPDDEVFKSMSPEAQKRFLAVEAVAKKHENDELIAKARSFGVGDATKLGPALGRLRKTAKAEDVDLIEQTLAAAGAAVKKSALLRPISDSGAEIDAGSAIAKARELASNIRKDRAGVTEAQALAEVWTNHPELYEQYCVERAGRAA